MKKEDKKASVEKIKNILESYGTLFVVHYRGLSDFQLQKLRNSLKVEGCGIFVPKNSLAKIALKSAGMEFLNEYLRGPTSLIYSSDIIKSSKVINNYLSEYENLVFVGGSHERKVLDIGFVRFVATLGSESEVKAKFVGLIKAPMSYFVSLLQAKNSMDNS